MSSIIETAVAAGSFNTLVAAVKAADLVDTLSGAGPFTVLAPTDEAFAKIPSATLESLLLPEGKDLLVKILTYHVLVGKVMSSDIIKLSSAKTVLGQPIKIDASHGVQVNDAMVVTPDIECDNGVIHVIDTVLMPS